jgi:protein-S-isoprenylcysteine O-methyltransferase Ste14
VGDVSSGPAPPWARLAEVLARKRVALGFLIAVLTLILADPTWQSWAAGLAVAAVGEAFRIWAAGHLEKGREVTRSGPYRWTRHPLYAGSSVIAIGVAIAARSPIAAALIAVYMAVTIAAAVRTEERFLRVAFGTTYDDYRQSRAEPMDRTFSLARARRNREQRAIAGLIGGFALLALKVLLSI